MAGSAKKEVQSIIKKLQGIGIECDLNAGHWKIKTLQGVVMAPSTPSDHRSIANLKAQLRSHGINLASENGRRKEKRMTAYKARQTQTVVLLKQTLADSGLSQIQFVRHIRKLAKEHKMQEFKNEKSAQATISGIVKDRSLPGKWLMDLIELGSRDLYAVPESEDKPDERYMGKPETWPTKQPESVPNEPELWVRILAAILDPNTTREEAYELSALVRKLEGSR